MTNRKRWPIVLLTVIVSAVLIAVAYSVYWVADIDNGTEVLSNDNEAYFFIKSSRLGYQFNLLQFVGYYIAAGFGVSPTETQRDLVVVRVTGTGFQRNRFSDITISRVGVLNNRLYTFVNGRLMRLTGTHFEAATAAQEALFKTSDALLKRDGWSW